MGVTFYITPNVTVDIGPNIVTVVVALIAFATLVFNGVIALKTGKKVNQVLAEQKPNGGLSQRDAIDRIEEHAKVAAEAATAAAAAAETASAVDAAVAASHHSPFPPPVEGPQSSMGDGVALRP